MLIFNLKPQSLDPLNIGLAKGATVTLQAPVFAQDKSAWECAFSIEGADNMFYSSLYGVSEFQAIELVINFINSLMPQS